MVYLFPEKMDKNTFFRETSIRITGHLDIEKALYETFIYLKDYIPADALYLELYNIKEGTAQIYASAGLDGGKRSGKIIHLPPEAAESIQPALDDPDTIHIINNVDTNPVGSVINQAINQKGNSVLAVPLYIEKKKLGGLIIEKSGYNAYSQEHADLAKLLIRPCSIALANCLQHDEIRRLSEIVMSDKKYLQKEMLYLSGDKIIGADYGLKGVMEKVRQVAHTASPVLLLGETGVGKDIVANAIHYSSDRKDNPFIKVNSGAIPESLMDSELFGHEKGAFTGAAAQKRGRFERAHTGTLFLDEIGELPAAVQVRLLRVLQNREFERVGGTRPLPIDVRIITATHKNLEEMIAAGEFRKDLWFRLNVFPIKIPPLRERKEDIPSLINYFIHKKSIDLKLESAPALSGGSLKALIEYNWPGNVRELENVIERALILHSEGELSIAPLYDSAPPDPGGRDIAISGDTESGEPRPGGPERDILSLDEYTTEYIKMVLTRTRGKIHGPDGAAALLKIKPTTLRYKMDKLHIPYRKSR